MVVGICGIYGRMGGTILRILIDRGHTVGAGFDVKKTGKLSFYGDTVVNVQSLEKGAEIDMDELREVDGFIDFSSPGATLKLTAIAAEMGKPVVTGTTGFTENEAETVRAVSEKIPLLFSPNMSVGVNLLFKLTEIASKAVRNEYDIEIFEAHHKFKKDAPSGTAKRLVQIIKENIDDLRDCREVTGRDGITGERSKNEIGIMAMRGGDIVGEHTVFYTGMGERIELTHRATSRDTFAMGAVKAMEFLVDKKPGLYSMFDVLGL